MYDLRKIIAHHHEQMTFGIHYGFSENVVLPLSHDEVVHGKGSMLGKMPGDTWQKFANLCAYYAFMWTHPTRACCCSPLCANTAVRPTHIELANPNKSATA